MVADHMPPELIRIMWGYSHGRSFESRVDALKCGVDVVNPISNLQFRISDTKSIPPHELRNAPWLTMFTIFYHDFPQLSSPFFKMSPMPAGMM